MAEWIIDGMLSEGLALLRHDGEVDATALALQAALAVSCGEPFLEKFAVSAGDVFYLAMRESERSLKERLSKMLSGQRWPVWLLVGHRWRRMDEGGYALLEEHLYRHPDTRLIVLDGWESVAPRDGSDSEWGHRLSALGKEKHLCILALEYGEKETP